HGQFQAQGGNTKLVLEWAQEMPLTARDARKKLQDLENLLTRRQRVQRRMAFQRARNWIAAMEARGGVEIVPPHHISKTWSDPQSSRSVRVDIEVWAGWAFVPDLE